MRTIITLTLSAFLASSAASAFAQIITPIAEINAVDEQGGPVFEGLQSLDHYTVEGVAICSPDVMNGFNDGAGAVDRSFILFMQDDSGGIQVYSGAWYGGGLDNYPDVERGDRLRVTGLTGFFGGKTNINERHNPDQRFEIEILSKGETVEPAVITDLDEAARFDPSRESGGEWLQGRLVEFAQVRIVEGEWIDGGMLTVENSLGQSFPVQLRHGAAIAQHPQPDGWLNIRGVFTQEDTEAPFTEGYMLWPRDIDDFMPAQSGMGNWHVYR